MAPHAEIIAETRDEAGIIARLYADGVMLVEFARGVIVDADLARANRAAQHSLTDGPYVLVADVRDIAYADKEARAFFATDERRMQRAIAMVVGPRISRYITERWVNDHELDRPVAVFTDLDDAFTWARRQLRELVGDFLG